MANLLPDDYGLSRREDYSETVAPDLQYQPPKPRNPMRPVGLIGCGGISAQHLNAYRSAGLNVVALCSRNPEDALQRQKVYFPHARLYSDYRALLADDKIEVVDIATHPADRVELIEAAISSGKHILSQKPFVTDLEVGERLADKADRAGIKLAVNQNGRWAPHLRYLTLAIRAGLIGDVTSLNFNLNFDHSWVAGTAFDRISDLVLYDFGIHWFDIVRILAAPKNPLMVLATTGRASGQTPLPPMLAGVLIDFGGALASMTFNGSVTIGQEDRTVIAGTRGSIASMGPSLSDQSLTLNTSNGRANATLRGTWFLEGFQGSMTELLCAIDENRDPENNARDNLQSLALCFAAIASAVAGVAKQPGSVRSLPER